MSPQSAPLLDCSQGSLRSRLCVMGWNLCSTYLHNVSSINHWGEPFFYLDAWYRVDSQLGQPTRSWSCTLKRLDSDPTKRQWLDGFGKKDAQEKIQGSWWTLLGKMLKMATIQECPAAGGLFEKLTSGSHTLHWPLLDKPLPWARPVFGDSFTCIHSVPHQTRLHYSIPDHWPCHISRWNLWYTYPPPFDLG